MAILHSRRARATFYVTVTSRAAPHRTRRAEVTRIDPKLVRAELGVGELRHLQGLPPRPVTGSNRTYGEKEHAKVSG